MYIFAAFRWEHKENILLVDQECSIHKVLMGFTTTPLQRVYRKGMVP